MTIFNKPEKGKMEDEMPGWAKKNQALVIWKRTNPLHHINLTAVRVIDMEGSYRDPESEIPISGDDLLKKLLDDKQGWRCLGVYLVNEEQNGIQCQKAKAIIARFPLLRF